MRSTTVNAIHDFSVYPQRTTWRSNKLDLNWRWSPEVETEPANRHLQSETVRPKKIATGKIDQNSFENGGAMMCENYRRASRKSKTKAKRENVREHELGRSSRELEQCCERCGKVRREEADPNFGPDRNYKRSGQM